MEKQKISFSNIKDVLSRDEMKKIMAGSGDEMVCGSCYKNGTFYACTKASWSSGCKCSATGYNC